MTPGVSSWCSDCDVHWPRAYGECPGCDGGIVKMSEESISAAQAEAVAMRIKAKRKLRDAFEQYYLERELALLRAELDGGVVLG